MPSIVSTMDENNNPFQLFCPKNEILLSADTKKSTTEPNLSSGGISLKRKRPPKIQIPSVLKEIQVDKVRIRDFNNDNKVENRIVEYIEPGVGVFSIKGKKKNMEDSHMIALGFNGNPKKGFFGVYDGHGGRKASDFVAENLHKNIMEMMENSEGDSGKKEAIKAGYLKTDQEFLKQGLSSGSCCVTCLIEEEDITVSNLGDCRAVLCRGGVAEALTMDHTARREDERNRIESKGGYVEIHRGGWRVHGILSVSRSIGDVHLKEWVVAEPDTKVLPLTPDMEFLVLASDGLWEKVDNQEAIDIVKRVYFVPNKLGSKCDFLKQEEEGQPGHENISPLPKTRRISVVKQQIIKTPSPKQVKNGGCKKRCTTPRGGLLSACKELVNLALTRGSLDDITVMIIDLSHFRCNR
ncbi:probable protein phosphatase 2C 14 isoform X1 [Papaver somniferum]|uniref:probable protein phosphatase 2C 14 isoform X1 n=1 Tax=Papaver somniferum TaxID=3469 RepID=UPI000E6F6969|nr:probable protein phosphatase 2C 14 isoform X1 [Papaver somniferum]